MNRALLIILSVISFSSFGQQWSEYKIDSTMTITIPDNFQVVDTMEQRAIKAQVDNGLILITLLENKGKTAVNAQNERELIDWYKGFQKGFINSQRGELIKEEIIEINGLKYLKFSIKAKMGDEQQIRHCLAVFVNDRTYVLNFWELESMTDEMTPIRDQFFNSIKLPSSMTIENQMSHSLEGSRAYNIGYLAGQILGFILILGVIIYVGIWISKMFKK